MAESETGQERTEEATPKRKEKAREDGQVPRSRELNTTFVLLAGVGGLLVTGGTVAQQMLGMMRFNFDISREVAFDSSLMLDQLGDSLGQSFLVLLPVFAALMLAAAIAPVGLGGFLFSGKSLMPKFSRMNPLSGLKKMFSMHALVELLKAVAKFMLVAGVSYFILSSVYQDVLSLGQKPLEVAIADAMTLIGWAVLGISCATILIAIADVPFQIYEHNKKLKMTMQEIKDEFKETEGKPEVKGRIRQLQREMANRRMMEAVPDADVVITNPEHFSVALKYDMQGVGAPRVVAKGVDQTAMKIREIANAHEVLILASPALARAVYFTTELDDEIPSGLYLAVAQVLAYVFQLQSYRPGRDKKPSKPKDLPIPSDMRYDSSGKPV